MRTVNRHRVVLATSALLIAFALLTPRALADIFQWEWVDPNDHALGKRQSSTLCPDGGGADPLEYHGLWSRDLTKAYLFGFDFHTSIWYATLDDAYLAGAQLDGTFFQQVSMLDADLTGASFVNVFQNGYSHMDRANFTDANLTGTHFRYSYLTDVNFTRANLTNVKFNLSTVHGADFTDAVINGARFEYNPYVGFTALQLYSTRSYKDHDLRGVRLSWSDMQGWNFSGQDLTGVDWIHTTLTSARFDHATLKDALLNGDLTGADFTGANATRVKLQGSLRNAILVNADFSHGSFLGVLTNTDCTGANFTGTNLTGVDLRGARNANLSAANTSNAILPDGTVNGATLDGLAVHNYHGATPIPLRILDEMNGVGIEVFLDADPWGSTIGFEEGIPVQLWGSRLWLNFEPGVDHESLIGMTYRLFDWTGVVLTDEFDSILTSDNLPYQWDTSRIYTDGTVTLLAIPEPSAIGVIALSLLPAIRPRRGTAVRRAAPDARAPLGINPATSPRSTRTQSRLAPAPK
jgi:uncharacterized protein YjbI with pentapeptide repeats